MIAIKGYIQNKNIGQRQNGVLGNGLGSRVRLFKHESLFCHRLAEVNLFGAISEMGRGVSTAQGGCMAQMP